MRAKIESRAAIVVASLALFVALGGTSYAMVRRINGSALSNRSVSGEKLKRHTVTATELDVAHLPQVPSARQAALATSALHADSATNATNAANAANAVNAVNAVNATNATNATNAANAMNATTATDATNATNATNVGGHTFAQIDAGATSNQQATLLNDFDGLTLMCSAPSGSSGTVTITILNGSANTGEFGLADVPASGSATFTKGPVQPATNGVPSGSTFSFPVSGGGGQVSFSYESSTTTAPQIITGTVTLTLDNGCSAFGNAEAS